MTPKEKALELINKYYHLKKRPLFTFWKDISYAKKCSLIAVNEIMIAIPDASDDDSPYNHELVYWQQVKQEIQQL